MHIKKPPKLKAESPPPPPIIFKRPIKSQKTKQTAHKNLQPKTNFKFVDYVLFVKLQRQRTSSELIFALQIF